MWGRLRVQRELVPEGARDSKCQRYPFSPDAKVVCRRASSGKWTMRGLISCMLNGCACCGPRRSRHEAPKLAVALQRWLQRDAWCDAALLTLAPPHRADEDLEQLVDRLYDASARLWRTKAWRDFARRWGVEARVRSLDSTHGGRNGSHPHFHVLLLFSRAAIPIDWVPPVALRKARRWRWDGLEVDEELELARAGELETRLAGLEFRAPDRSAMGLLGLEPLRMRDREARAAYLEEVMREQLLDAWERAVEEAGIEIRHREAFRSYSLKLSPGEAAAAYLVRWGLADEVGAPSAKARSHLRLLDLHQAGHAQAGELYLAWRQATRGHAWLTGHTDLYHLLGVTDEDGAAYLKELQRRREKALAEAGTPIATVRELELVVPRMLLPTAVRVGWEEIFAALDEADRRGVPDLQAELEMMLRRHAIRRGASEPLARNRGANTS
jgi:replication protein